MDILLELLCAFAIGCLSTGAVARVIYINNMAAEKVAQALFYSHMMDQINKGLQQLDMSLQTVFTGIRVMDEMIHPSHKNKLALSQEGSKRNENICNQTAGGTR